MATTTASRKQKGRRLQQHVVAEVLSVFPELTDRDVKSAPMGTFGEDVLLSEKAFRNFPFSVEAKNQEKLNIWKALEQAEQSNRPGIPLLVFSKNRTPVYCALKFEDFMGLVRALYKKDEGESS